MVNFPGADGLSVKTNLSWIPEAGVTEPGRDWPVVATILEVKKAKRLKAGTRS